MLSESRNLALMAKFRANPGGVFMVSWSVFPLSLLERDYRPSWSHDSPMAPGQMTIRLSALRPSLRVLLIYFCTTVYDAAAIYMVDSAPRDGLVCTLYGQRPIAFKGEPSHPSLSVSFIFS